MDSTHTVGQGFPPPPTPSRMHDLAHVRQCRFYNYGVDATVTYAAWGVAIQMPTTASRAHLGHTQQQTRSAPGQEVYPTPCHTTYSLSPGKAGNQGDDSTKGNQAANPNPDSIMQHLSAKKHEHNAG